MGLISSQFPFTDPGSLMGGVREHRVSLNNVDAEAFRTGAQKQLAGQSVRAFSGAESLNELQQDEDLTQTAIVDVDKSVTINPVVALNPNAADFDYNYLQRYVAGADAHAILAKGAANVAQDQGTAQDAYAELKDFDGTPSNANNLVDQRADVVQQFDVALDATVDNTTVADTEDTAFNQARFRLIEANLGNLSAQAAFATGQAQGRSSGPVAQIAISNGAVAENDLLQSAGIEQVNNLVALNGDFDLSRNEDDVLSPRTTLLQVKLNELAGMVCADLNSSAASQEQAHLQNAAGGVNHDGQTTENDGLATNRSTAALRNTERTTVTSDINVII